MNIFDFLTQDEIDDAPEDNALAFTHLARICQKRLGEATKTLSSYNDSESYHLLEEAQLGFMSTIIGLGRSYGVEPFSKMDVPEFGDFTNAVHRQFKADLDHYMAQLVIGNSLRGRRESIRIAPDAKERIRTHLHHIKNHLDKAEIDAVKRKKLLDKLAEFESALEKDRLNVFAVSRVVLEIMSFSVNVLALADSPTLQKLLSNVMVTVAEAKAIDDERRLPPSEPPPVMLPPRREEPNPRGPRENFSGDLDDEIPF